MKMNESDMKLMRRGLERDDIDGKMCKDDEKGVKVGAIASDLGENEGKNGGESVTVGDEGKMRRQIFNSS